MPSHKNTADCVCWRGCYAFVVKLLEVDFDVGEVVLVCLAVANIKPDFRLEILQNCILQHERAFR